MTGAILRSGPGRRYRARTQVSGSVRRGRGTISARNRPPAGNASAYLVSPGPDPERMVSVPASAVCPGPAPAAPRPPLAQAHRHVHRAALEAELLAQPPLDEPPVAGFEEPGGEQHEMRRADPR